MKTCSKCKAEKSLDDFYRDNARRDKRQRRCKSCSNVDAVTWRAENPARAGEIHRAAQRTYDNQPEQVQRRRLRQYGLTAEQYAELELAAAGCCAICGDHFVGTPHIDHCHQTGRVRGLLCGRCNKGLGHFRDDVVLLQKAATYLA